MADLRLLMRYREILARRKEMEGQALLRAEGALEKLRTLRRSLEERRARLNAADPEAPLAAWFDRVRFHSRLTEEIHSLTEEEFVARTRIRELRASLAIAWKKEEGVARMIEREQEREAHLEALRARREEGELITARHSLHPR